MRGSNAVSKAEQEEFDQSFKDWEVKNAVIGTKLQAYLIGDQIPERWTAFCEVVTRFYALEGINEPQLLSAMSDLVKQLRTTLGHQLPENANWMQLRASILQIKSEMINAVLRAKIWLG